jgi:hypothetical protein
MAADLVLIDGDIEAIPADQGGVTGIALTIAGGRVTHDPSDSQKGRGSLPKGGAGQAQVLILHMNMERWRSRKNRHLPVILCLRPPERPRRKYRLTEAERRGNAERKRRKRRSEDAANIWRQGGRIRQKFWCAACFVSALFEN